MNGAKELGQQSTNTVTRRESPLFRCKYETPDSMRIGSSIPDVW